MTQQLFFLSLFLLFPVATDCMKRKLPLAENTIDLISIKKQKIKQISIQTLQGRRNKLLNALESYNLKSKNYYLTKHCSKDLLTLIEGFHRRSQISLEQCCMIEFLAWIKVCPFVLSRTTLNNEHFRRLFTEESQQYSLAGLLTMSVKNCFPCETIGYNKKKENLSRLFNDLACPPTLKDKELAIVEKWERCKDSIKNIYLFNCIVNYAKQDETHCLSQIPQDLIKYISFLIFDTEELLF